MHHSGFDAKVLDGRVNVAVVAAEGGDDLVDVEASSDHERSTPAGVPRVESDERVTLDADGLAKQAVDQRVARLGSVRRRDVNQLECPREIRNDRWTAFSAGMGHIVSHSDHMGLAASLRAAAASSERARAVTLWAATHRCGHHASPV
jgi:hypothetical protein